MHYSSLKVCIIDIWHEIDIFAWHMTANIHRYKVHYVWRLNKILFFITEAISSLAFCKHLRNKNCTQSFTSRADSVLFRFGASQFHINVYYWGRLAHMCVCKLANIGSDNGLSHVRWQAIIWTNFHPIQLIWYLEEFVVASMSIHWKWEVMMTSSNGNIFRITGLFVQGIHL